MIEYVSPGISPGLIGDKKFIYYPFNAFHNILPLHLKFMQECYVAVENDEPLGLINLGPDGHTRTRWKINSLVLGMNAYDIGKQLIDYVVNKYGGAGVETFLTIIDENYTEAIALFKNACFFRSYSKINIYEYEDISLLPKAIVATLPRKAELIDAEKIYELDSDAILPQYRSSLAKTLKDFEFGVKSLIINKIKGYYTYKYVLDNPKNNTLEGLVSIISADKKNFWVDITVSLAYKEHFENLLNFAAEKISFISSKANIYIGVKDYHQINRLMTEVLENNSFRPCGNFQILVKDYWKPAEFQKEKKVPVIIFPDMTSPACNITRFISET
jgi:hypothetical protein